MSWARFGDGDVYVFEMRGKIVCCDCSLLDADDTICATVDEMIEHLRLHEAAGHDVKQALASAAERITGGAKGGPA